MAAESVEVRSVLWNDSVTKLPVHATAQIGASGRRWVGVDGRVASSVLGPGTQVLLVAGECGQSLVVRVQSCAPPFLLSGVALLLFLQLRVCRNVLGAALTCRRHVQRVKLLVVRAALSCQVVDSCTCV